MRTKNSMAPTLRSWIVAGTLGTSLALLFDGERGTRRRAQLRDRGRALYRQINQLLRKQARFTSGKLYGNVTERLNMHQPDNPDPDDNTLRDRIESEVFGHDMAPKGEYNLNVVGGIAVLRGQLNSEDDIQLLINLVGDVPDVRGVESYLHTPGTPAPNKESAIEASDAS